MERRREQYHEEIVLRFDLEYETQGCKILREGTMTRVEAVTKWGSAQTGLGRQ